MRRLELATSARSEPDTSSFIPERSRDVMREHCEEARGASKRRGSQRCAHRKREKRREEMRGSELETVRGKEILAVNPNAAKKSTAQLKVLR